MASVQNRSLPVNTRRAVRKLLEECDNEILLTGIPLIVQLEI